MDDFLSFAQENHGTLDYTKGTWKILIVDDDVMIHKITKIVLKDMTFRDKNIEFLSAYSEKQAREVLFREDDIAVVLLDVVMEENDSGLKLVEYIRNELKNSMVRIILRTGHPGSAPEEKVVLEYDINDYKEKTELTKGKLFTSIINALRSYDDMVQLDLKRKELKETQKDIIMTLSEIAETRSKETGNHVKRVSEFAQLIGKKYGFSDEDNEILKNAAALHDIGKIVIADSILLAPRQLTAVEFDIMKNHTVYGYDLLKSSKQPMLQSASVVALQHHERYDGKGYPNGLSKDEIHIFARIVSIADVFDALSTDRVYRKAWTLGNTLEYMKRERDRQFDPFLLDIFINSIDTVKSIMNRFND